METIATDLRQMQRMPLAASHVAALRAAGRPVTYPAGAFLAQPGNPADRFTYVEEGEVGVVNPCTDQRHLASTLGPTRFMGEIAFLNGGAWSMPMRAVRETRVIEVPREAMPTLMAQIPEMSDIVITVLAERRRRQLDERDSTLQLIGEDVDRNVRRIAEFANRNRIPYTVVDAGQQGGGPGRAKLLHQAVRTGGDFRPRRGGDRSHARQDCAAAWPQPRPAQRRGVRRADRRRRSG